MPKPASLLLGLCVALLSFASPAHAQTDETVTVFAAASLRNALDDAVADYGARTGNKVTVSYAGSPSLARQIAQGAPADIFLSANVGWMDALAEEGLIEPASRVTLLGNSLVLVAPADSAIALRIAPGVDLAAALDGGRMAIAETSAVPAGIYARAALQSLSMWDSVAGRLAQAENVRAALALVSRGETPLGIVYATDAKADAHVRVVDMFPAGSHPPILYPAALTADARPAARDLYAFLVSPQARRFFQAQGFVVIAPGS